MSYYSYSLLSVFDAISAVLDDAGYEKNHRAVHATQQWAKFPIRKSKFSKMPEAYSTMFPVLDSSCMKAARYDSTMAFVNIFFHARYLFRLIGWFSRWRVDFWKVTNTWNWTNRSTYWKNIQYRYSEQRLLVDTDQTPYVARAQISIAFYRVNFAELDQMCTSAGAKFVVSGRCPTLAYIAPETPPAFYFTKWK